MKMTTYFSSLLAAALAVSGSLANAQDAGSGGLGGSTSSATGSPAAGSDSSSALNANQPGGTSTQSGGSSASSAQDAAGNQATSGQSSDGSQTSTARDSAGNEAVSGQSSTGQNTSTARDSAGNRATSTTGDDSDENVGTSRANNRQSGSQQRQGQTSRTRSGQGDQDLDADDNDDFSDIRRDGGRTNRTQRSNADDDVDLNIDADADFGSDRIERRGSNRVRAQGGNFGLSFGVGDNDALRISRIERNARASRFGFRQGDVIVSIDGRRISSQRDYDRWVSTARTDSRVPWVVTRDGRERTIYVEWEEVISDEGQFADDERIIDSGEERASLGVVLDRRYQEAAVVQRVQRGSPADRAGLRPGDQIVAVDGQSITSSQDLTDAINEQEPGARVEIEYTRRERRTLDVTLGSSVASDTSDEVVEQRRWYRGDDAEDAESFQVEDTEVYQQDVSSDDLDLNDARNSRTDDNGGLLDRGRRILRRGND